MVKKSQTKRISDAQRIDYLIKIFHINFDLSHLKPAYYQSRILKSVVFSYLRKKCFRFQFITANHNQRFGSNYFLHTVLL